MSDVRPELRQLALELDDLTWMDVKSMAVQLGVRYAMLEQIECDKMDHSSRRLSVMATWLDIDPGASWKKVISALTAIDKNVLALQLEKKYPTPPAAQPVPPTSPGMGEYTSMGYIFRMHVVRNSYVSMFHYVNFLPGYLCCISSHKDFGR